MSEIEKICVIGAGVMGSGIAAQAANAGVDVVLLDVVPDAALSAIERMKTAEPAAFMPIRADGLIGPRTETAFRAVLPAAEADRFTSRLGHNLGFFDFDDTRGGER